MESRSIACRFVSVVIAVFASFIVFSCSSGGAAGSKKGVAPPCKTQADCDPGYICVDDRCVPSGPDQTDGDGVEEDAKEGEEDYPINASPLLQCPNLVHFGAVPIGSFAEKDIEIMNVGDGPLIINSFGFDRATEQGGEFSITPPAPEEGDRVTPNGTVTVTLRYEPLKPQAAQELAVLITDDPESPYHEITLTSDYKGIPDLVADPENLDFEFVQVSTTSDTLCVTLSNEIDPGGNKVINVERGGLKLESREAGTDINFDFVDPPETPFIVSPVIPVEICLLMRPVSPGVKTDTLIILNDDPEEEDREKRIPLSGTGQIPGLVVSPSQAIFPGTKIGTLSETQLLFSRSADYFEAVTVTEIAWDEGETPLSFALLNPADLPLTISDDNEHPVTFTFAPTLEGLHERTATIGTDPALDPALRVVFSGMGGCDTTEILCDDLCVDAFTVEHCDGCTPCPELTAPEPHGDRECIFNPETGIGDCGLVCEEGWAECNEVYEDGCEHPVVNEDIPCCDYFGEDDPYGDDIDQNCDGVDGRLDQVIYVSSLGPWNGDGSRENPFPDLKTAIEQAPAGWMVWVTTGDYPGPVTLKEGVHIIGNFNPDDWSRDVGDLVTRIFTDSPDESENNAQVGVYAPAITASTYLDSLSVEVADNLAEVGGNYGVWAKDCGEELHLRDVTVLTGMGGPGADGVDGEIGPEGGPGGPGQIGFEDHNEDLGGLTCNNRLDSDRPQPGSAGTSACGMNGGSGGYSGRNYDTGYPGGDGIGHPPGQGAGNTPCGAGGNANNCTGLFPDPTDCNDEGLLLFICVNWDSCNGCGVCSHANGEYGGGGIDGRNGDNGSLGDTEGLAANNFWLPSWGEGGENGVHGTGGSGGGGGGGGCNACNSWGSTGGGGGGGGCGGTGGTAGQGGGGSFGLFLVSSSPTVEACILTVGFGGQGGDGGIGKSGGTGGSAGEGDLYNGDGEQDDGGCGGWGGSGGSGGDGGHGGPGAGGPSYGLVKVGGSDPAFVNMDMETDVTTAGGGAGGAGGWAPGQTGEAGNIKTF